MKTIQTINGTITGQLRIVRGYTMSSDGFVAPEKARTFDVVVDAEGRAYPYSVDAEAFGPLEPLAAERWGDGDRLGGLFSPDAGEFERCGIAFELCGTAAA